MVKIRLRCLHNSQIGYVTKYETMSEKVLDTLNFSPLIQRITRAIWWTDAILKPISSADADAFRGQPRSLNMVPFNMFDMVSY